MAKKNRGLGRGLDALLPEAEELTGAGQEIAIGDIDPNPDQPRRVFQEESIAQLAQSIREQGVLQPLLVTPTSEGRYRIVAGERRWRAARAAGLETVPCVVRELSLTQQMEIALIENLQREDLNPIEVAQGIRGLMQQCGYTQETVATRLSKSRPTVANLLRLLTLPESVTALVSAGTLSAGHARVLAGLEDDNLKAELARRCVDEGWSVRQMEQFAAALRNGEAPARAKPRPSRALPVELSELEGRFRETMGVRATLTGTAKKGRIVLQYYSQEELEHLSELLERLSGE